VSHKSGVFSKSLKQLNVWRYFCRPRLQLPAEMSYGTVVGQPCGDSVRGAPALQ
jgi:hypothetical protein